MEVEAVSSSSLEGRTSLLYHSVDPWGALVRGQREGIPGRDPNWGWLQACLCAKRKKKNRIYVMVTKKVE